MRLIYFTTLYPFGGPIWKSHELENFRKDCDDITVVPYTSDSSVKHWNGIDGIKYDPPLFNRNVNVSLKRKLVSIIFSKHFFLFLSEFLGEKVFCRRHHFISWITESYKIHLLARHPRIKYLKSISDHKTIWYFFWGREASLVTTVLGRRRFKVVCRFHGYDLYRSRNEGYIPFQAKQISSIDLALPCSKDGMKYIKVQYPSIDGRKIFISRLGSKFNGLSRHSEDGVLRLVSCSSVIDVKRVNLLLNSLRFVDSKIEWTHVGDGKLFEALKTEAESVNRSNVAICFKGGISSDEVVRFYASQCCDLFLNVSISEGVPVSIMEAFSAGIPVFATDVGGTGEIVDMSVGRLMPKDLSPELLAQFIDSYANLSAEVRMMYRKNAYNRFLEICDIDRNSTILLQTLKAIID